MPIHYNPLQGQRVVPPRRITSQFNAKEHDKMASAHQKAIRLMQDGASKEEIESAWAMAIELGLSPEKRAEAEALFASTEQGNLDEKEPALPVRRGRKPKSEEAKPSDSAESDIPDQVRALQARQKAAASE